MPITAKGTVMRLRALEEANNAFATDGSGTLGNYLDVPFIRATCRYELNHDMIDPGMYGQTLDHRNRKVRGVSRATLSFDVPLATHTVKPAAASQPAQGALGRLLKISMGGQYLNTARAITTGATVNNFPVTASTGLGVGGAISYPTGTGGRYEVRAIRNNAANAITPKHALSTAPANGATGYPAATYFLGGTYGDQTTYLQTIVEGLNPRDRFLLLGGWCTGIRVANIGPTSPPGSVPTVGFDWAFANWVHVSAAAGSANLTGALGRATYANNVQLPVKDSEFRYQVNGTSTIGTRVRAPVIEFTPRLVYDVHSAPDGVNTIVQPIRVPTEDAQPFQLVFTEPLDTASDRWRGEWDTDASLGFWHQIGSTAAGQALIECSSCQVVNVQDEPGNITGVRVTVEGGNDADTITTGLTGVDLDRALSTWRIHLL